jgi:hypothetical protein
MKFKVKEDQFAYYKSCNEKCLASSGTKTGTKPGTKPGDSTKPGTKPQMCSKVYVDCSKFGGYDPKDKCKQTCLKKEDTSAVNDCKNSCSKKAQTKPEDEQVSFYKSCQLDCNKDSSACAK